MPVLVCPLTTYLPAVDTVSSACRYVVTVKFALVVQTQSISDPQQNERKVTELTTMALSLGHPACTFRATAGWQG
jgi:hypothetical protein